MPPSDAVPFSPIAITGRACLLPGAHTPEELFALARGARDLLRDAPAGRWRAPDADVLSDGPAPDHAFTKRGGYVEGFAFDPRGYAVEPDALAGLDPLTQWVLDTGRRALADAGASGDARTGAVLGNLSLPSSGLSRFAESVWLEGDPAAREALGAAAADPRDRFMSGLPAHLLASALGLGLGGYALDAACASSLYAVELACRALQSGRADRMLAGAVSRADDLFLHVGFCALGAMSRTGQSRPFHAKADGLVCGEGCGFVVLERLEDAVAAGRTIHGVIRGVGLANDGRGKGILAPSADGQARSMRAALAMAGLAPEDVAYVECHATGTTLGDATELDSMRAAYGEAPRAIGSLKGNLGHLITAAGVAGLIKLLESLREGELLPSPHTDRLSPAVEASPFEVLSAPRPWTGPRRAGLSAFGFGGNDAHLIVEAHDPSAPAVAMPAALAREDEVVVVALGARVGAGRSRADLEAALFEGAPLAGRAETVRLPFASLRFPPADLQKSSAQQTMLLAAALEATEGLALPRERTGVFVGYGCDPEIARWGARWRVGQASADAGWIDAARDAFAPPLEAPHVVGVLPNMPANRLSSQLDLVGPSHTVSAEEQSGVRALEIALDALRRQDLDAAIVGAVDLSDEPVHRAALRALGERESDAGDAALVLVLKRRADAEAEGLPIFASVERAAPGTAAPLQAPLPRAHAAKGLLDVTAAVLAAARARHPGGAPWDDAERALDLRLDALGAAPLAVRVRAHGPALPPEAPRDPGRCLELSAHPGPVALPPRPDRAASSPSTTPAAPSPSLGSAAQAEAGAAPSRTARAPSPSATPVPSTEAAAMPSSPFQTMAPAPSLPPVTSAPAATEPTATEPTAASGPRPASTAPAHAGLQAVSPAPVVQPAPAPTSSTRPAQPAAPQPAPHHAALAAPPSDPLLAQFLAHQRRIGELHQDFIAQQQALHARFLETVAQPPPVFGSTLAQSAPTPHAPTPHAPTPHAPVAIASPPAPAVAPAPKPTAPLSPPAPASHATPVVPPAPPSASPKPPRPAPPVAEAPAKPAPAKPAPAKPAPSKRSAEPAPEPTTPSDAELPLAFRPTGPTFDRDALRVHAGGRISEIFGPDFARQDPYPVQVRMPRPPLLLATRCTGMDAKPGALLEDPRAKGTCWTETDVTADDWFLHDGRMPTGVMVESGQADLFLISYLGADFLNRGERAYRLLGCEMTWRGDLPAVGETMAYDIHVDGHAKQGDVRLFFFHYDCWIRRPDGTIRPALEVRSGQAGFFTRGELDDSAGTLWKPEEQEIVPDARVDPPAVPAVPPTYDRDALAAFADGRPWDCFGPAWARTKTHTRTPRIQGGDMLFLDTVELDPRGGPWGRGYLKAVTPIRGDEWFFDGHFEGDPCMPGTLMLEGCVQAMAFYLAAQGYTIDRDGWRFQPVPNETFKLICRGQVIPESKELTYEVFVEECHDGPEPTLYADLLCTVDGLGAFHARRFALKLTPDWPLTSHPELVEEGAGDPRAGDPRAAIGRWKGTEHRFDLPSLLACAWGQPSTAFGPMYARFDGTRRTPRLPGPPYHFLTRVTKAESGMGALEDGESVDGLELSFEYDVPEDAWYFDANGARVMPFAVLLEAALQPCGWTASYVGCTLTTDKDLLFRNLDGRGTVKVDVLPDSGTLRTDVRVKSISRSAGMIITSFEVRCFLGETEVYELDTVFGFFPPEAFEDQAGLPVDDAQRALFDAPEKGRVDLTAKPERLFGSPLRLADPRLLMIDRVTHLDLEGGAKGLGAARAEKDVDAGEWFFKAHFYQDPVQPGSLGIEAMLQLLQAFMIEAGMGEGVEAPRFEAIATGDEHIWKYRGQVVPENELISTTLEVVERGVDARGPYVFADAHLWVDGKRIYGAPRIGMRIVSDPEAPTRGTKPDAASDAQEGAGAGEVVLDASTSPWLADHCPTYALPALPMMSIADRMLEAARAELGEVEGLSDLQVERWVVVDGPTRTRTELHRTDAGHEVRFLVWRDAPNPALSRFEVAARATVGAPAPFEPLAPLETTPAPSPYAGDALFHGPAFHYVTVLETGPGGARATLDPAAGAVPRGATHQGVLDALTHLLPHDRLHEWSDRVAPDQVAYPRRLDLRLHAPIPDAGPLEAEARFVGFEGDDARFPVFRLQLRQGETPLVDARLVEILMPKGRLGVAAPPERAAFLRDGQPVPGLRLSEAADAGDGGGATTLDPAEVRLCDWLPGTVRRVYAAASDDLPREVAAKEHVAAKLGIHPRHVALEGDLARAATTPLTVHPLEIAGTDPITVQDAGPPRLDLAPVTGFWREWFGVGPWPVEDLDYALIERFVRTVHVADPDALAALHGQSVLYLANHQVGIESLLFSIVAGALQGVPSLTLAKKEHRESWLGRLIAHCFTWPGVTDPGVITYFDRSDPASLPKIVQQLADRAAARSLMVHVEGTRSHDCRTPVKTMSGVFVDLAVRAGVAIVPVRFSGGLPVAPTPEKLEYPVGMGTQDYWLGAPISPAELEALPYKERTARVVDAINALGPAAAEETPHAPDPELEAKVLSWVDDTGAPIGLATVMTVLADLEAPRTELIARLAEGARTGQLEVGDGREEAWLAELARLLYGPNGPTIG